MARKHTLKEKEGETLSAQEGAPPAPEAEDPPPPPPAPSPLAIPPARTLPEPTPTFTSLPPARVISNPTLAPTVPPPPPPVAMETEEPEMPNDDPDDFDVIESFASEEESNPILPLPEQVPVEPEIELPTVESAEPLASVVSEAPAEPPPLPSVESASAERVDAIMDLAMEPRASNARVAADAPFEKKIALVIAGLAATAAVAAWVALTIYRMMSPAPSPTAADLAPSPVAAAAAAPTAPPPPRRPSAAVFSNQTVTIASPFPSAAVVSSVTATVTSDETPIEPPARAPSGPRWTFDGMAFDLMTGRPVFAAKLTLIDAKGRAVGSAETDTDGHFVLNVPAGDAYGYALRIKQPDYLNVSIDQGENTLSLREASEEDRKVLIHAAHGRPWIGRPGKTSTHDLALIPVNADSQ